MKIFKQAFLLSFFLFIPCFVSALGNAKIGNIVFGDDYNKALTAIKQNFGVPDIVDKSVVEYKNKNHFGVNFDKVIFRFTDSKLVEACFISYKNSKNTANKSIQVLADIIKSDYDLSMDIEDDGTYFYKGGLAKSMDGRLFTLFIRKYSGRWTIQMRYGPYKI